MAGIELDPWEELVLRASLGEREDGRWAAFEVGLNCPRQNGKNEILLSRELVGLFLLNERLIQHSAHMFDTSLEAFRRLVDVIENTPRFSRRVKKNGIKYSHGEEGVELRGGQRIRFRTRGGRKGGGRGFTGDLLIFDEAMDLAEATHGAVLPTLSARSVLGDPQVWYAGSAVDQWVHDNGVVFARIRERGLAQDPELAYFEWSIDAESPDHVDEAIASDPESWAQANPGLGIRISSEHVARERRSMDGRTFAVERLGAGDWPDTSEFGEQLFSPDAWAAIGDTQSKAQDPVCFAFDVSPDRKWTSIGVAGRRKDALNHTEVVERRRGTGWLADRMTELVDAHQPVAVGYDRNGPAATLAGQLENLNCEVKPLDAKEFAQACSGFFDAVEDKTVRHLKTAGLTSAVKGAVRRPLGDAWAFSRKSSAVDITPLVACAEALWALEFFDGESPWERRAAAEESLL